MRFRLVPVDEKFFDLFQDAAANALECAQALRSFIDDPSDEAHAAVKKLEKRGDELTAETLQRLHQSFVTPIDREDIHALAEELDDAVDDMFAAADTYYLTKAPKPLEEIVAAADLVVKVAQANASLMNNLKSMRNVEEFLETINQLESEGDAIHRQMIARLFSGEFEALDVLRWRSISEALENAINAIEDISDIAESIVLKHG